MISSTAAFFAMDMFCYHRAIADAGTGVATILPNTQVLYSALAGLWLFRERPSGRFLLCIPAAFAGIWLLVGTSAPPDPETFRRGAAFGLAAGPLYAGFLIFLKKAQSADSSMPPAGRLAAVLALSAALLIPVARLEGSFSLPSGPGWFWILLLGLGPGALGWVLISESLPQVPISRAGLLLILQPVLASLWGWVVFSEPWSPPQAAGGALTLLAVYLGTTARLRASP